MIEVCDAEDALAGEGWVQGDGGYPITSDSGAQLPDSDRDLDARLDALVKPDSDLFQAPANLEQDPALHSKAEGLDSQEGLPPPEDTKGGSLIASYVLSQQGKLGHLLGSFAMQLHRRCLSSRLLFCGLGLHKPVRNSLCVRWW